jgi:hypothetical protein
VLRHRGKNECGVAQLDLVSFRVCCVAVTGVADAVGRAVSEEREMPLSGASGAWSTALVKFRQQKIFARSGGSPVRYKP